MRKLISMSAAAGWRGAEERRKRKEGEIWKRRRISEI